MFADRTLAARIDRAEARMCAGFAAWVRSKDTSARTRVDPLSGGLAVYVAPSSPMNKIIGVGLDGPLDLEALSDIERHWREQGEPVRVELSILADATVAPALSERGYRVHGFENVLGRSLDEIGPEPHAAAIAIDPVNDRDWTTWIDVAASAFLDMDGTGSVADDPLPREELERALAGVAGAPGYTAYLARVDGQAVGEAALHMEGGLAQVAGAGVLPAFRGRGVQKALLHRRLTDARAAGCDLAVVTTAPGTRSQDNVMRRGFVLLYTRAILVRRWEER